MKIQTKKKFTSDNFPGVVVEYRALSEMERSELDASLIDERSKGLDAQESIADIVSRLQQDKEQAESSGEEFVATMSPREQLRVDTTTALVNVALAKVRRAWLDATVLTISGVTVEDGDSPREAEVEEVLDNAPAIFLEELYGAVVGLSKLSEEEEKNSESPSTSTV